jgi:predicted DNA binding CopG/RHH family protein
MHRIGYNRIMTTTTAVFGPVESRPRVNVTIRLEPHELEAIDKYADADGRSRSSYIRRIIAGAIQRESQ